MDKTQADLSLKQLRAMIISTISGRRLQIEHPEIADLYRRGYTLGEIVEELDICNVYNHTEGVAINTVQVALAGYKGGREIESYDGLLSSEEREELLKIHRNQSGLRVYEEGKGVHEMTDEERKEVGRRTYEERKGVHGRTKEQRILDGKSGGKKTYKERKGIHGRTKEQMRIDGVMGGKLSSHRRKGVHEMTDEERHEASRKGLTGG